MRHASTPSAGWHRVFCRALVAFLAAWLLASCTGGDAGLVTLDRAWRSAPDGSGGREVRLSDAWNPQRLEGRWHYALEFQGPAEAGAHWGLYVPRAGNRLRLSLNGEAIAALGSFDGDDSDHAQQPHHFDLPPHLLRPGTNRLLIEVQGERARYAGLSVLTVGPAAATRPTYLLRLAVQTWGSFAIVSVAVVFAAIAGALAFTQRDRSYAIFALACVFCAIKTSWAVVSEMPFDHRWWTWLTDTAYAGYLACLCLFVVSVLGLRRRWIAWATGALLLATAVLVPLHAFGRQIDARQAWTSAMVVYALALCALVIANGWRHRTRANAVMGAAGAAAVALAVYDHVLVFYSRDGYSGFALARYSLLVFLMAMGWMLVERQARTAREEAAMRAAVERELQEKRRELDRQFELQRSLLAERAQQQARQGLLRDIHDGMGLHLNGLLGLVEGGALRREELSLEVRTAIEQMRLLVDSGETFDGDLGMLAGQLRHQLERRLRQAGVQLDWSPRLQRPERLLRPVAASALQRLVFELTTNVIRHAQARRVTLVIDDAGGGLQLSFEDDGRGFDAATVRRGHGLDSLARRTAELGGEHRLDSRPGGPTRWRFELPPAVFDGPA